MLSKKHVRLANLSLLEAKEWDLLEITQHFNRLLVVENLLESELVAQIVKSLKLPKIKTTKAPLLYDVVNDDNHLGGSQDYSKYLSQCSNHDDSLIETFGFDFASFFDNLLSKLTKLPLERPVHNGVQYKSCIVKIWKEGVELPAHFDSALDDYESGAYLKELGDTTYMMSFVFVLDMPEGGGELVIYDMHKHNTPKQFLPLNLIRQKILGEYLDRYVQKEAYRPKPNTMMLFRGGTPIHKVMPPLGKGLRVTVGGSILPSYDRTKLYYWG
jgi:hypothetical protein